MILKKTLYYELTLSDSELKVLLLDKLAYADGSIKVFDGVMMMSNKTPSNEVVNKNTEDEDFISYAKSVDENSYRNEPFLRKVLGHIPITIDGLLSRRLYMPSENTKYRYLHNDLESGQ